MKLEEWSVVSGLLLSAIGLFYAFHRDTMKCINDRFAAIERKIDFIISKGKL